MWTDRPAAPASTSSRAHGAPITPTCGTPSWSTNSSWDEMVASQRDAASADMNPSQITGAATSTGRVPGRRCTLLTCISIRSNW
jgi:hypothetical protein